MLYRPLGDTGLSVSVIGVGTWQFGGEWGATFRQRDVDEILDAAAECGINLIDTAECYGDHLSERLIGDYLARRDRSRWIIATKFGHQFNGFLDRRDDFSVEGVRPQLAESLRALRVEQIDVYQFHSGPDAAFNNDALWSLLHASRRDGSIGHLGVSVNKTTERQAYWAKSRGVEVVQLVYNRLDQSAGERHFPFIARDHLGALARVPLASGLLSGKYGPADNFPSDDVRSRVPAEIMAARLAEVDRIRHEEAPPGVPLAQWAIAWCLANPLVTAVIPGCKTATQVRANAAAATLAHE